MGLRTPYFRGTEGCLPNWSNLLRSHAWSRLCRGRQPTEQASSAPLPGICQGVAGLGLLRSRPAAAALKSRGSRDALGPGSPPGQWPRGARAPVLRFSRSLCLSVRVSPQVKMSLPATFAQHASSPSTARGSCCSTRRTRTASASTWSPGRPAARSRRGSPSRRRSGPRPWPSPRS